MHRCSCIGVTVRYNWQSDSENTEGTRIVTYLQFKMMLLKIARNRFLYSYNYDEGVISLENNFVQNGL
jgi:hypothetical protein